MTARTSSWLRKMAIFTLPLFLMHCDNEEPDNTGLINCSFALFSNAALQGKITITQAYVNLERVDITGTPPSQDIVNYSRQVPSDDSWISLLDKSQEPIKIEAKTNHYDPFSVTLKLGRSSYDLPFAFDETGNATGLDDYLQNGRPALLIAGKFDNRGTSMPIFIAITEVFPLKVNNAQYGTQQVKIDLENSAEILFNPVYLFQNITTQKLEAAEKIKYLNQDVIFIHPQINNDLYASMLQRLEDTSNSISLKITVTKSAGDR